MSNCKVAFSATITISKFLNLMNYAGELRIPRFADKG